jgi:hypothetical protein
MLRLWGVLPSLETSNSKLRRSVASCAGVMLKSANVTRTTSELWDEAVLEAVAPPQARSAASAIVHANACRSERGLRVGFERGWADEAQPSLKIGIS